MNSNKEISRRGFLKTAAVLGAALTIQPAINKVQAANAVLGGTSASSTKNKDMQYRTLGTGSAAFEVSALGFGVMGMTYNRSQYPDKKTRQRVIAEAVDRGVNLFDTAIIYGPLNNEEFAGEVLAPIDLYIIRMDIEDGIAGCYHTEATGSQNIGNNFMHSCLIYL